MKYSAVLTGAFEPTGESFPRFTGDGGLTMTRAAHENGDIAAFSQKHQN
jgi:hypothetical protein